MTAKKKTTARTTGLTGNQFASVEQGRSYVLSVHSPSGAGEIELPAPRVAVKIFTSREIPALKKKDKDLMEFLKWIAGTKSE